MADEFEIVLENYHGSKTHVVIPDGVTKIAGGAFYGNSSMTSVSIPGSVTEIGPEAFSVCENLTSVSLPESAAAIGQRAFFSCVNLRSITIPDGVTDIGRDAFGCCPITVICRENSCAHRYCAENHLTYIFDYQLEAFHGFLPHNYKKLASPFLADEEKPFIFISYSHRDRDEILPILKTLYESGWKIWYDEGLTIGDKYDETLEEHVRNCSAFLLFASENSVNSYYCIENEIPWAYEYGKPIIRCDLNEGLDFEIREGTVAATVSPEKIEPALKKISGLARGEHREAKGISVVVNPADRDGAEGDGFACCLYTADHAAAAKAVMLEAKNSGCTLYDAVEERAEKEELESCACLIVFLDRSFLANEAFTKTLAKAYLAGRDLAVCQLESIRSDDLPQELLGLRKMQWLNFVYGISADMVTKLVRHLQKRGCRNSAILPGFEYEKTEKGIIIKKYTGIDPNPRIERNYGVLPVTEIADEAFHNCTFLTAFEIPDGIKKIGRETFRNCGNLASITIPDSITEIEAAAFGICQSLTSVSVPDSVRKIERRAFAACSGLKSITLPDGLAELGEGAFFRCESLLSISLPASITKIESKMFANCESLQAVMIPAHVTEIGDQTFLNCKSLRSVILPNSVARIGKEAFLGCQNLTSVTVSGSVTEIGEDAFGDCPDLTVKCSPDTCAWKYCVENNIAVKE